MGATAFVPLGVFVLVVGSVGWRLIHLWRRTRQAPELLLGAGLVTMSCVALPLAALGRVQGVADLAIGKLGFGAGALSVAAGAWLMLAFTRCVFRPDATWARTVLAVAAPALTLAAGWMGWCNFTGTSTAEIVIAMRPGTLGLTGVLCVTFLWSGVEALRYYASLRRRLALGLADPVVANRFLLWGLSGIATVVLIGIIIGCVLAGMVIVRDPIPLTATALCGTVMSVSWYLTFFAPKRYHALIRSRAARRMPGPM